MHRHLIVPTANCKNVIPYAVNLLTLVPINEFHQCKESKEQKTVNYDGIVAPVIERHFCQSGNKTLMVKAKTFWKVLVKASFPMLSIPCILHNDIASGISDRSLLVLILSDARLAEVLKVGMGKHVKLHHSLFPVTYPTTVLNYYLML